MERKLSRRNILGAAGAFVGGAVVAVPAVAGISTGNDAELLAMIAKAEELWAQYEETHHRHINLVISLLSPERESHSNEEWFEAAKDPDAAALEREGKALHDAALALDEPIRNFQPKTLEGAVAQADFIRDDDDFKEIVLANLRRIVEGRS
jgi:hypothetical protein